MVNHMSEQFSWSKVLKSGEGSVPPVAKESAPESAPPVPAFPPMAVEPPVVDSQMTEPEPVKPHNSIVEQICERELDPSECHIDDILRLAL